MRRGLYDWKDTGKYKGRTCTDAADNKVNRERICSAKYGGFCSVLLYEETDSLYVCVSKEMVRYIHREERVGEPGFRNRGDNSGECQSVCHPSFFSPQITLRSTYRLYAAGRSHDFPCSFPLSWLVSLISFGAHQKRDFKPPNASFPKTGSLDAWSHLGDCKGAWE